MHGSSKVISTEGGMTETLHLPEKTRDALLQLKRKLMVDRWNVLCRLAICSSLGTSLVPPIFDKGNSSNVEIDLKTLFGGSTRTYLALVSFVSKRAAVENDHEFICNHIHRGALALQKCSDVRDYYRKKVVKS
jgi:DNA sulfur modification protein DndE